MVLVQQCKGKTHNCIEIKVNGGVRDKNWKMPKNYKKGKMEYHRVKIELVMD